MIQKAVVGRRTIQESSLIPLASIAGVSEIALCVQVLEKSLTRSLSIHSRVVSYSVALLYPLITSYLLCVVYLLDVHGQSTCYLSSSEHNLFAVSLLLNSYRLLAISFSLAMRHLLRNYLQPIPLPVTNSLLAT